MTTIARVLSRALLAASLLPIVATDLSAQRRRLSPISIEMEATGGWTLVDIHTWVRPGAVTDSERELSGFMGRIFFTYLNDVRLGVEAGRQHLFWYDVSSDTLQRHVVVHPWYGGLSVRLPEAGRFTFDFGMGMYRLEKDVLAFRDNGLRLSTSVAVGFKLIDYRGLTLPIGLRLGSVMDNRSALLPVSGTVGLAFRPFRGSRATP